MKKYFKKIGALLIAVMMLVAMAVPVSAATATINITNADEAELHMVQVIAEDPTSATGWKFVNGATEFKNVLGVTDDQAAIAKLIKLASPNATLPSAYSGVTAATNEQLQTALNAMTIEGTFMSTIEDAAGMYAIRAEETGYVYQDMAVYVDFEGATTPNPLNAKKSPIYINKEITNTEAQDQAVAIGDVVTYTITSSFPYIRTYSDKAYYKITDKITGAAYDTDSFEITLGGVKITDVTPVFTEDGTSFTIDLTRYITADNANANKQVIVTYKAKVTDTSVNNTVSHDGDNVKGEDETDVYTGTITLTKYAENTVNGETVKSYLSGAEFTVTKAGSSDALTFTQDVDDYGIAIPGKYTYDPTSTNTIVVTDGDGLLEVKGLDEGNYHFTEVKAPDGYSINENGADATLTLVKDDGTVNFVDETDLKDTKLSALPSTGSVGTYLFTIIGVGVMAVMVSLFTIKRRRDAK